MSWTRLGSPRARGYHTRANQQEKRSHVLLGNPWPRNSPPRAQKWPRNCLLEACCCHTRQHCEENNKINQASRCAFVLRTRRNPRTHASKNSTFSRDIDSLVFALPAPAIYGSIIRTSRLLTILSKSADPLSEGVTACGSYAL